MTKASKSTLRNSLLLLATVSIFCFGISQLESENPPFQPPLITPISLDFMKHRSAYAGLGKQAVETLGEMAIPEEW